MPDMSDILISIIAPVYKVEPYIRRCVESIIGQTYRKIEVLLVDDGSPDHCGAICDEYARRDERITVIHQENKGLSAARNAALDMAKGDYLMFVDSDDWVEPDFCAVALRLAQENQAQVVSFGYNEVFFRKDGKMTGKKQEKTPSQTGFMEANEAVRHLILRDDVIYNFVWNKLFRRSLWGDTRFPEGRVFEDQAVTYLMMIKAGKVYVSDAVLYNYTQRPDSIMSTMSVCPKTIADCFTLWKERLPVIRQYCPENERFQLMAMANQAVSGYMYIHPESEYGNVLEEMKDFLSSNRERVLRFEGNKTMMLKIRFYYYCRPLLFLWKGAKRSRSLLKL